MGLFSSNDITAVDLGAGSIKIARIQGGTRPRLVAARLVEFPVEQAGTGSVSAELGLLRSEKKLWAKKVVTLVPGKYLTIRHLTLPKMPQAELREAVQWETKRHISYPLDNAMIEHLVLGERREGAVDKYDVLLVAADRNVLHGLLAPFFEVGIPLVAVDANPLALRNVLRRRIAPNESNALVVDIGAGKTEINIFKEGSLRFSRCIETGGLDMTRTLAEDMNLELQDAERLKQSIDILSTSEGDKAMVAIKGKLDGLLLEIRRSVDYYKSTFREKAVERAILTGGVSLMRGIKDYFSSSLEGPVELCAPFEGLSAKRDVLDEFGAIAPRFSAAVGLALRRA